MPAGVPPQLPLYHCQLAPVPRVPPLRVRVEVPPAQILADKGFIVVAAVDMIPTLIVTVAQFSELQFASDRT